MYQQKDYQDVCAQRKARLLSVCGGAGALLALTLIAFFARWPQAVTTVLCGLAFCAFIFGWSMLVAPLNAYRKHIDHALRGHTHDTQGVFAEIEDAPVVRDGVSFWPMTVNVGAGLRDDGNRLFYYDANLPRPDFRAGETLLLTSYDNRVTAWSRVQNE